MRKLLCVLFSIAVLFSAISASAASSEIIVGAKDGSLELKIAYDEICENAKAYTAMYFEGELIGIIQNDLSINSTHQAKFDFGVTPDKVVTYFWQDNLKPLCKSENALTAERLAVSNQRLVSNFNAFVSEANTIRWKGYEKQIIALVEECALDATTLNQSHILSPEYLQRYYADKIDEAKSIYDNKLDKTEKSAFRSRILDMDIDTTSYLIDFFGLKKFL